MRGRSGVLLPTLSMTSTIPPCPVCSMENTYPDGEQYICADCGHEWPMVAASAVDSDDETRVVKDANGNVLVDGDSCVLIKDLKVKGTSITLKAGTKIRNIRLADGDHDIDCKVDGTPYMLKAMYMKKA